jgi:hypothetical protein
MSYRVPMDVIHVTVEVSLIADEMFPEYGAAIDLVHPAWRGFAKRSPFSMAREKYLMIGLQRVEKSVSPGPSVQTQCK